MPGAALPVVNLDNWTIPCRDLTTFGVVIGPPDRYLLAAMTGREPIGTHPGSQARKTDITDVTDSMDWPIPENRLMLNVYILVSLSYFGCRT